MPGDVAHLLEVGKVADDDLRLESADGVGSFVAPDVDDDLVPAGEKRLGRQPPETVGGAGDEDARYGPVTVIVKVLPEPEPRFVDP